MIGDELVPVPARGRVYRGRRRTGLGDTGPGGGVRLDAIAGYLQDVSNEDTTDAGFVDVMGWVVRRTVIDVIAPAGFAEMLELATFCSGAGSRWAERRVSIRGERGAHIEAATLWVHVDTVTLRPKRLPAQFFELFGDAAGGRVVRPVLGLGDAPLGDADHVARRAWLLRHCDYDVLGHVNNAAYWQVVEEALVRREDVRPPLRGILEFRTAIAPAPAVDVATVARDDGIDLWLLGPGGVVHAAAAVTALRAPSVAQRR